MAIDGATMSDLDCETTQTGMTSSQPTIQAPAQLASTVIGHVPGYTFDTRRLPPELQFEAWRKSFSPILKLTEPDDSSIGFKGKQVLWDLGSLAFSRIKTDALAFESLGGRAAPLDHWTMTSLLYGRMSTFAPAGKSFESRAGKLQIHSLCQPFEGHLTQSEMLTLFIPRDFSAEVTQILGATELSTIGGGMGRLFSDYLLALAKRLSIVDAASIPSLAAATRAMILACVVPSDQQLGDITHTTTMLERARRFVQRNLSDFNLDADRLSAELCISRAHLYRLFEPFGGVMRIFSAGDFLTPIWP